MNFLPLSKIQPDKEQPRKLFAAEKMHSLKESIKKHGIKVPLVVEKQPGGTYLLIDGERRFRAASDLKLKEVPVIIEEPKKGVDRLIEQFQIQEQHEGWTPVEKANALLNISQETGLGLKEAMGLLNISADAQRRYMAFALLSDRTNFMRRNVSMDWAMYMNTVRSAAQRVSEENNLEFNRSDEKKLESRIVDLISNGEIKKRGDISKIKDSFQKNPKLIEKFLRSTMTQNELYKEAKAKGAYHLRNAAVNANYVITHGRGFMQIRDVKISDAQLSTFKNARKILDQLISMAE